MGASGERENAMTAEEAGDERVGVPHDAASRKPVDLAIRNGVTDVHALERGRETRSQYDRHGRRSDPARPERLRDLLRARRSAAGHARPRAVTVRTIDPATTGVLAATGSPRLSVTDQI